MSINPKPLGAVVSFDCTIIVNNILSGICVAKTGSALVNVFIANCLKLEKLL